MPRNPDLYALVAELRSYRRSQKQIAHALNISKTYVSQICRALDRETPQPELPPLLAERIADYKAHHAR